MIAGFRQGPKHMMGSAIVGAVLLGFIEGMGYMLNRYMAQGRRIDLKVFLFSCPLNLIVHLVIAEFRPQDMPTEAPQDPAALGAAPSGDPGFMKL